MFYTAEFVYNAFLCNVNSPITLYFVWSRWHLIFCMHFNSLILIIIMIFYCGLMVHITVTRTQKVVSYTSAHITETVLAHDQHWEEHSSLSSPQLHRHSQKHRKWITIGHYTTGVSTCPALRRASPRASYFFLHGVYTVSTYLLHKSNTGETQTPKQFTDNYCIFSPYRSVE